MFDDEFDPVVAIELARAQRKLRNRRSGLDPYGARIAAMIEKGASLRDVSEWLSIQDPSIPNAPSTVLRFLRKRAARCVLGVG